MKKANPFLMAMVSLLCCGLPLIIIMVSALIPLPSASSGEVPLLLTLSVPFLVIILLIAALRQRRINLHND